MLARIERVITTVPGAGRLGGSTIGLKAWETTTLEAPGKPTIEITATPCRHGPPLSRPIAGHVIGFALRWEGQEHGSFWMSGDTVLYDGIRQVARRIEVGVALLHLGAVRFPITGPISYSMTAKDAVEVCKLVKPHTAIPVHYEGWSHFSQGRDVVELELAAAPAGLRSHVHWLTLGEPAEVTA